MNKIIMTIAAVAMFAGSANALTIKTGEVLTTGADGTQQVVGAGETETAQRNLDNNGYHVGGGMLFVQVDEVTVAVDLNDLRGLSKEAQRDVLRVAIGKELGVDYVVGDVTEQHVLDGLLDDTIGSDTAIFDATDEAIAAYEEQIDAYLDSENAEAIADGHVPCYGCTPEEAAEHAKNG